MSNLWIELESGNWINLAHYKRIVFHDSYFSFVDANDLFITWRCSPEESTRLATYLREFLSAS